MPPNLERWRRDLDVIYEDVIKRMIERKIWREYAKILERAPRQARTNATFHNWVTWNHLAAVALCVRGQTDDRRRAVSLLRLLRSIAQRPSLVPVRHTTPLAGSSQLTRREALADVEQLLDGTKKIVDFAHTQLAHLDTDRTVAEFGLTIGAFHDALGLVFDLMNKYAQWIQDRTIDSDPILSPGWDRVFLVAWREPQGWERAPDS